MRRLLTLVVASLGLVVIAATPAVADPAGPSDFRSEVTGIEPAVAGVTATIRGGDSFLELSVDEGLEVVVAGYAGEDYLRFRADGVVERNLRSPATYLNEDRLGATELPATADPEAEPEWEEVASGATYAWHDHRVHWMSEASPPVERGEQVEGAYDPWRVPITVDGAPAEVLGTLTFAEATSPLPWAALGLGAAAVLALLGRRAPVRAAAGALAAVSALAVVVGRADWAATPDGTGNPLLFALPAVALVTALAAVALAQRGAGVVLILASVATLSAWAFLRIDVLLKPVLPTELPAGLDRASVALALGVSVGAAYLAVTSGALTLPALADDE